VINVPPTASAVAGPTGAVSTAGTAVSEATTPLIINGDASVMDLAKNALESIKVAGGSPELEK